MEGMNKSFGLRGKSRKKGQSITDILEDFPHFLSYQGEVITKEFVLMHPNAKDMCSKMNPLLDKVQDNWQNNAINPKCKDSTLKSVMISASKLPHSIDRSRPASLKEKELVVAAKVGQDIDELVDKKQSDSRGPVQPYLIAVVGNLSTDVLKLFLVLDGRVLDLGRAPLLRGIDWVFKSCVVFNVHYPSTWTQFFRFLQTCFYEIFLDGIDDVPPSSMELLTQLLALQ